MQDFEKLGVFYLGRPYDIEAKKPKDGLLLYDSRDLVTHAVCVGMTGSGKTGLCIGVIEEAAIDGVPAIVIDPKGDLANLLLTFPDLRPSDFRSWINEDDARRIGASPDDYAEQQAARWKKGLAEWGQDGDRIRRLRDAAEVVVYTPGSSAGLPVSVLASFAAPPGAVVEDAEAFREQVTAAATGLLGLLEIDADPLKSREHTLLSAILSAAWKDGRDLDLAALIQQIQAPPMTRIGVLELESFFPAKERFGLAMAVNGLLASPGFDAWLQGEPLDISRILHGQNGKPRIAIFSIAHLADSERMFFVSFLLNRTIAWMRSQSGTTSLRALLYMDEIFGYFPPVANPPSKTPLLTLLKQARAFGLGVVLATQNPVDLDYKGLSNAGTWFLGRLQTERDKARVLDGLEGAAAGAGAKFDRRAMEELLAGLGSRIFLMNNVHDDAPVVFESRWTLSYLRGPLSRDQIRTLMAPQKAATAPGGGGSPAGSPAGIGSPSASGESRAAGSALASTNTGTGSGLRAASGESRAAGPALASTNAGTGSGLRSAEEDALATGPAPVSTNTSTGSGVRSASGDARATGPDLASRAAGARPGAPGVPAAGSFPGSAETELPSGGARPVLPPDVPQFFLTPDAGKPASGDKPSSGARVYLPKLLGTAQIRFADRKAGVDETRELAFLTAITDQPVPVSWDDAAEAGFTESDLAREPEKTARFAPLHENAVKAARYGVWGKDFSAWLQRSQKLDLLKSPGTGELSQPDESERDFRVRLGQKGREQRDQMAAKLRQTYAPKIAALEERIRRSEQAVARESEQAQQAQVQTAISIGATLLGSLFGRRTLGVGTIGRATTAARGVSRSMREAGDVGRAQESLEALKAQLADLEVEFQAETDALTVKIDPLTESFDTVTIQPAKKDIAIRLVALVWIA